MCLGGARGIAAGRLGLNPFVAMFSAGFLAVVFYRQGRHETNVRVRTEAAFGSIGGLLSFAMTAIFEDFLTWSRIEVNRFVRTCCRKCSRLHHRQPIRRFWHFLIGLRLPGASRHSC